MMGCEFGMDNAIEAKLIRLIQQICRDSFADFSVDNISADTDVQRDLGFDSIMLVVLQIQIEDMFQIRFNAVQDDLRNIFTSIASIAGYIQQHMGA